MDECPLCHTPLGDGVLAAARLLYGPPQLTLTSHLLRSVGIATTNVDKVGNVRGLPDPGKRIAIGEAAVIHAFGISEFSDLADAYAHYGDFYECRDLTVQDALSPLVNDILGWKE